MEGVILGATLIIIVPLWIIVSQLMSIEKELKKK